jgi:flagellar assembly protein FliH
MQKYRDGDIKPFQFNDLKGESINSQGSSFKPFAFDELNGESVNSQSASEEDIRVERTHERKNNFKIDSAVRDMRGISRQEQSDFEARVEAEVERRIKSVQEKAYQEGVEQGKSEGKDLAYQEYQEQLNTQLDNFSTVLSEFSNQGQALLNQERHNIYEFIKRFTKWIVLKEIDEKLYLEKLLEKLILELNAKKNLIIKVGKNNFKEMPDIIAAVEARLGTLQNTRVEIVPEIQHPGIILEADNGLIDGSLEGVFGNIDHIFQQVLGHE